MAREMRKALEMEEFAMTEFGASVIGVIIGGILHMVTESLFDTLLKDRYPDKYPLYSTGITSSIFTTIAVIMFIYGKRTGMRLLEYIGAGIIFVEVGSWLDMIRVSFAVAR
jgi:predicted lysophospholipase L1 biosynthesis ABC-type transport system permease subunit